VIIFFDMHVLDTYRGHADKKKCICEIVRQFSFKFDRYILFKILNFEIVLFSKYIFTLIPHTPLTGPNPYTVLTLTLAGPNSVYVLPGRGGRG
jgi:hypothetical protein